MILPRAVLLSAVCAFCTLLTTWSGAHAAGASQTEAGLAHYSGGVTDLELKEVALRRPRHNFVLQVVSALSGGPIADAEVKITDIAGKLQFGTVMDGPWLLVTLAPGRYRVAVSFQDEVLRRDVQIAARGQSRMTLGFRSSPEVSLLPRR